MNLRRGLHVLARHTLQRKVGKKKILPAFSSETKYGRFCPKSPVRENNARNGQLTYLAMNLNSGV